MQGGTEKAMELIQGGKKDRRSGGNTFHVQSKTRFVPPFLNIHEKYCHDEVGQVNTASVIELHLVREYMRRCEEWIRMNVQDVFECPRQVPIQMVMFVSNELNQNRRTPEWIVTRAGHARLEPSD